MKAKGIYAELFSKIAADEASFPSLPEVVLRLRDEVESPTCDIKSLTRLIQVDVAMAAFIVKASKSIRFFTLSSIKSLHDAVRRMGLSETYHVALTFFARSQFEATDSRLAAELKKIYMTSVKTAAISALLAQGQRRIGSSRAILGGLLQDIGAPLVLAALVDRPEIYNDPVAKRQALDELTPLVGLLVLEKWGFDNELKEVVRNRHNWSRQHEGKADLTDMVLVASRHALIDLSLPGQYPPLTEITAFDRMSGLALTPDNSLQLIKESNQEIRDIESLLSAGIR